MRKGIKLLALAVSGVSIALMCAGCGSDSTPASMNGAQGILEQSSESSVSETQAQSDATVGSVNETTTAVTASENAGGDVGIITGDDDIIPDFGFLTDDSGMSAIQSQTSTANESGSEVTDTPRNETVEICEFGDGIDKTNAEAGDYGYTSSTGEYKRCGRYQYGFVDIPYDWVDFKEAGATIEMCQFSDKTMTSIVTMSYYDSPMPVEELVKALQGYVNEGESPKETYKVTIGNQDGYMLVSDYTDGTRLKTFVFKGADNRLHQVAVESLDASLVDRIMGTYRLLMSATE